ncbi:MAG TPA: O-acetylhomoserine aminocarboxypropyltransferase/cysteine synthase [Clostridia bacterium]|jgi:O-acetylhomoserine (thiol)-lyase|nr:O-acetylhomoserine aminocarboxypropyltransferase/cysteine synthase [Clostridia bacterium]HRU84717.1 O-acetylhomoserine aminocarboxypropyltransferase/cysteine synthase [Eubacteriales bacterium]
MKIDTKCVQAGYEPKNGEPRVLPLYQSTTYYYETPEQLAHLFDSPKCGHIYSRISNPTVAAFEEKITALEGGIGAMACSSGQAATLFTVLTVANAGDNIISFSTIYGGTFNLFAVTLKKFGIETRFVTPETPDSEIEKLIDAKTKLIFGETIANPAMTVLDFERCSALAEKHGVLFVVDNTLATPVLVRPLSLGADVVVHSTTKYLDGHAACVGGVIVDGGKFKFLGNPRYQDFYTPDESYHGVVYTEEGGAAAFILKARMQYMRDIGAIMAPFNAYLTNLGTETLHLRMARHSENGLLAAKTLKAHRNVEFVLYPGLEGDKNHALAKKYFSGGYSGMVVFGIKGGRENAVKFIKNLKLFKQVTHIADARSCVLHPASTTHRQLSAEQLAAAGITDGMVRLSCGIEAGEDIAADIISALDNI